MGRGVNKADGSPDAQLRLKLGSGAGIITAIELRASGRLSGYWSTATTAKAWPLNVLRHGRPAGGAGLPLYLAIAPEGEKLDLLVQDNNAIASGSTLTLFITTSNGKRHQVPVTR